METHYVHKSKLLFQLIIMSKLYRYKTKLLLNSFNMYRIVHRLTNIIDRVCAVMDIRFKMRYYHQNSVNICINVQFKPESFQYAKFSSAGMSSSLEVVITSSNLEMSLESMVS